jgi:hypothetical protein
MKMTAKRGVAALGLSLLLVLTLANVANAAPPWQGVDDGTLQPYASMTRGQFVKMAVEAYNLPVPATAYATFADVAPDNEFYPYIEGAVAAGLIQGVSEGVFAPCSIITREQGAAIVARYLAKQLLTDVKTVYTETEAAAVLAAFADAGQVSSALVKEVAYSVERGILKGSNGQLAPSAPLSRLQGAAVLGRSSGAPLIAADVMAFLDRALDYVQTNGKAAALAEFMDKTGSFYLRSGELYIFAYDLGSDGMCLCLPPEPAKVGTSLWDLQDDEGKYFIREFYDIARATGSGWSTYRYLNPSQGNEVQDKTAYIMKVDNTWLMGAGVYGLQIRSAPPASDPAGE